MKTKIQSLILLFALLITTSVTAQKITTIAGNGIAAGSGNGGPATAAELNRPWGVAADAAGNIYIADTWNSSVRKINTSGIISIVAGHGSSVAFNGEPATSVVLSRPYGITFDGLGNYYFSDLNVSIVLKVNTLGNIYRVAGNETISCGGDGGPATAAGFTEPSGVAVDGAGNIFIADAGCNVIRKVNTSGIISTIAGTGIAGYSGDGGLATAAKLNAPAGIAVDGVGNLFIADGFNHRLRKINPSGIIATIAGPGVGTGAIQSGVPATSALLGTLTGVAVDESGNIYIADGDLHIIWKVNTSGIIYRLAGNGLAGFGGDSGVDTLGKLSSPSSIAVDGIGNIYIADQQNNRIRKIDTSHILETPLITTSNNYIALFPNPNSGSFTIYGALNMRADSVSLEITNVLGQVVCHNTFPTQNRVIDTHIMLDNDLANGIYLLHIRTRAENTVLRFALEK